jgi:hypothetical protein
MDGPVTGPVAESEVSTHCLTLPVQRFTPEMRLSRRGSSITLLIGDP